MGERRAPNPVWDMDEARSVGPRRGMWIVAVWRDRREANRTAPDWCGFAPDMVRAIQAASEKCHELGIVDARRVEYTAAEVRNALRRARDGGPPPTAPRPPRATPEYEAPEPGEYCWHYADRETGVCEHPVTKRSRDRVFWVAACGAAKGRAASALRWQFVEGRTGPLVDGVHFKWHRPSTAPRGSGRPHTHAGPRPAGESSRRGTRAEEAKPLEELRPGRSVMGVWHVGDDVHLWVAWRTAERFAASRTPDAWGFEGPDPLIARTGIFTAALGGRPCASAAAMKWLQEHSPDTARGGAWIDTAAHAWWFVAACTAAWHQLLEDARRRSGRAAGSAAPSGGAFGGPSAEVLRELRITWPCSADDVKRAFRKRALEVHPDRGGTAAQFVAVKRAYEAAMRAAGGTP